MRFRSGLACAAMVAFAAPALAADYDMIEPLDFGAPEFRGAIHDWSGPYIGVHAGWGWGRHTGRLTQLGGIALPPGPFSGSIRLDEAVFGVQAGYEAQLDTLVWGIEADFSYIDQGVRHDFGPLSPRTDIDWLASTRLKLGVAWDNVMPYATGGIAFSQLKFSESTTRWNYDKTLIGWVAGAGVEVALAPEWSVRGEWLYYDFGRTGIDTTLPGGIGASATTDHNFHTVRAALNYRFAP